MKKFVFLFLFVLILICIKETKILAQTISKIVIGTVTLNDDSSKPEFVSIGIKRRNYANTDDLGRFKLIVCVCKFTNPDCEQNGLMVFKNRLTKLDIKYMGYRTIRFKNIPLNKDTVDLGTIQLFKESTGDFVALDYLRCSWFSICKWRSRKYYNEFRLSEPDYDLRRAKMDEEIKKYNYIFNGKIYKIDVGSNVENDIIDLK
jgi:hypothetical protein